MLSTSLALDGRRDETERLREVSMTPFEFVFFLYALMLSLALTHLIGGWSLALRNASEVRWSPALLMWAVTGLFVTTGNLSSFWLMRDAPQWDSGLVLSNFAFAIVNYVWCVFLTPDADRGAKLDLVDFEERERRRFLSALIVLELIALGSNVANGLFAAYDNWLSDSAFTVIDLILTGTALLTNRHWLRVTMSVIIVCISAYFLISATSIISG
jgi:hypothetical protein